MTSSTRPYSTACFPVMKKSRSVSFSIFLRLCPVCFDQDLVHLLAQAEDLPRLDVDVGRLALHAAERLVDHDARVRQREALALGARPPAAMRAMLAACPMQMVETSRLDVLHGVVDREAGGHRAARAS